MSSLGVPALGAFRSSSIPASLSPKRRASLPGEPLSSAAAVALKGTGPYRSDGLQENESRHSSRRSSSVSGILAPNLMQTISQRRRSTGDYDDYHDLLSPSYMKPLSKTTIRKFPSRLRSGSLGFTTPTVMSSRRDAPDVRQGSVANDEKHAIDEASRFRLSIRPPWPSEDCSDSWASETLQRLGQIKGNWKDNLVKQTNPSATVPNNVGPVKKDPLVIEGGPKFEDALDRLTEGNFSEEEYARMRRVFNRFAADDDLDRDLLEKVLDHLGYFPCSEDKLEEIAERITSLSSFDFDELVSFLQTCAEEEKQTMESVFNTYSTVQDGSTCKVLANRIPSALNDLGMCMLRPTLEDLLKRTGLEDKPDIHVQEFARLVAAYRACEGFTEREAKQAQDVYNSDAGGVHLKMSQLPKSLLDLFGVHCIRNLGDLMQAAGDVFEGSGRIAPPHNVCFHEFLTWARRLNNIDLLEFRDHFEFVDEDANGIISLEELVSLMKNSGFTLFHSEVCELLETGGIECKVEGQFDLDASYDFLQVCRKTEGFVKTELEELTRVYKMFDTGNTGEITICQVLDLLRHLGYHVLTEDVNRYVKQVDFNVNGTMDVSEYLRLMRLHREDALSGAFCVFCNGGGGLTGRLPRRSLKDALAKIECCPSGDDADNMFREAVTSRDLSFEDFMQLADKGRKLVRQKERRRANFSDREFAVLEQVFNQYDTWGRGHLDLSELYLMLHRCNLAIHTAEGRGKIMALLDKAREAAVDAGVDPDEVGTCGSYTVTFWAFVQLLRIIARENEGKELSRIEKAREAARFSIPEVEDFRVIFLNRVRRGFARSYSNESQVAPDTNMNMKHAASEPPEVVVSKSSRRASLPPGVGTVAPCKEEGQGETHPEEPDLTLEVIIGVDTSKDQLQFDAMTKLLSGLKLRLSPTQSWTLQSKMHELTGERFGALDFANFIRLMRWMIDENFANLNRVTASAVKKLGIAVVEEPQKPTKHAPAVVESAPKKLSGKTSRRQSV